MQVKMLRNAAESLGCDLKEGNTGKITKELGDQLIQLGIAEEIGGQRREPEKKQDVKGIPSKSQSPIDGKKEKE